jgi:hypothetical protein
LHLDGRGYQAAPPDLIPLEAHPTLAELLLAGDCTTAVTLESLPALRDMDITLAGLDGPEAVTRLHTGGVTVGHRRHRWPPPAC